MCPYLVHCESCMSRGWPRKNTDFSKDALLDRLTSLFQLCKWQRKHLTLQCILAWILRVHLWYCYDITSNFYKLSIVGFGTKLKARITNNLTEKCTAMSSSYVKMNPSTIFKYFVWATAITPVQMQEP